MSGRDNRLHALGRRICKFATGKSKGEKEIWGFSKYYQQSRHRVNGIPDGIYDKEEIKKAHRFISEKGHEFDKAEIDYLFN